MNTPEGNRIRTVIMGAAGRDFHNFNMVYRDDKQSEVLAFTAAQIPGIAGRHYPPALSGPLYPDGIPIVDETELEKFCKDNDVQHVVFAYSDIRHEDVMHIGTRALACGADFMLLGPQRTMINANVPVIAVSAVRTGCGKSQTTRYIAKLLKKRNINAAVIRHPMPYGDLEKQAVQRFATLKDLDEQDCTIEEREEYEPLIDQGHVVFAGVDYKRIVEAAEGAADMILWDGGNNDFPFLKPDLHIVMTDALRPGHEMAYYPGEAALRMADIVIINKVETAKAVGEEKNIARIEETVRAVIPNAKLVHAASPPRLEDASEVKGKRVLVIEDGPTITHGGMGFGAGYVAAKEAGASDIIDPRPFATGPIKETFEKYPHIENVLPAMGYGKAQMAALGKTIDASDADVVVAATPINLAALIKPQKPVIRCFYEYADAGAPKLSDLVDKALKTMGLQASGRSD